MLIPIIPRDPDRNDFTCRDGEIDFIIDACTLAPEETPTAVRTSYIHDSAVSMTPLHEMPTATVRVALQSGDRPKAELMLSGQISRVDPATAERLTQAIVQKAAECLLDLSTDLRRQGLFILPFRFYTMIQLPDGTLSYPSPQGIALPVDYPPHPEITAASATDEALTLSLRFPVKPHRLTVSPSADLPSGYRLRTFISYPLYIPDPKEMRGSIGSVRSADGGNATGIRFAFLSTSAIKASVAAPEKYYEMVGSERTGYRISSKAAPAPDYSSYAALYGYVPPFPRGMLLALGEDVDADTDPLDWIADWESAAAEPAEPGYLPISLPYKFRVKSDRSDQSDCRWPDGIDRDSVLQMAEAAGASTILLTRPMTFATDAVNRRHAEPRSIRTLRVLGLDMAQPVLALLYGSDDGVRWQPLRRFDPRMGGLLLTPSRLFWRLLLYCHKRGAETVFLEGGVLKVGLRPLLLQ